MRRERGFTTIQYVVAVAFSLLLLVLVGNLLVDLYARGVVRDALDEGVRAAVPVDASTTDCETRVREVIAGLVRGPVLEVIDVRCERRGDWVVAQAEISLRSWLPLLVPDWRIRLRAAALPER